MGAVQTVVILGASEDDERYAFKAQRLLKERGHRVIPVNDKKEKINGDPTVASLADISTPVDTVTIYVRPSVSSRFQEQIENLRPGRVIFNPGTENPTLSRALIDTGITCHDECTLVLLRSNRF